jgi:hypothetical protein
VALSAGLLPESGLPLRLFATAASGDRRRARVAAALEISAPSRALLEPDGRLHDDLSYSVVVIDSTKAKVTSRTGLEARLVLKPQASGPEMPETVSYQVPLSLELAPGRYQLRAAALSAKLAKGGSVYLSIDVPDFSKEPLGLGGLTVGYADGARVPIANPLPTPKPSARNETVLPFAPSLDREFTRTDRLRVYFEVTRRNPATSVRTKTEIIDASGESRGWIDRQVPSGDSGRVDLTLPLSTLTEGTYILRVTAADDANAATREMQIVVR